MPAERTCGLSWKVMLWLLLAPLATAYPATSSPDAPATSAGAVTVNRYCPSYPALSFPDGSRASPLTRGPCAEGEWVVHDLAAAEGPRLRCALRPCPQGQVPWDGRCLSYADDTYLELCGGVVLLDSTGHPCCGPGPTTPAPREPTPPSPPTAPRPTSVGGAAVNCAQGDGGGGCKKILLGPPQSKPELEAEE